MSTFHYVACDLGAESGRVMLGTLAEGKLTLEEIHRFSNGPITVAGTLRWDVLRIFDELKTGLRKVAARGIKVESLSTDSWGVDYVLQMAKPTALFWITLVILIGMATLIIQLLMNTMSMH
jgi:rhamnulokinase